MLFLNLDKFKWKKWKTVSAWFNWINYAIVVHTKKPTNGKLPQLQQYNCRIVLSPPSSHRVGNSIPFLFLPKFHLVGNPLNHLNFAWKFVGSKIYARKCIMSCGIWSRRTRIKNLLNQTTTLTSTCILVCICIYKGTRLEKW